MSRSRASAVIESEVTEVELAVVTPKVTSNVDVFGVYRIPPEVGRGIAEVMTERLFV